MCHTQEIAYFGALRDSTAFSGAVDALEFRADAAKIRVAVLPDIYGLTDFYKGYASYLCRQGADTWLTNPWGPFGELPEPTREAAYERRHHLKDREHCDRLQEFLAAERIDAIVGFCIGGNFALEMAHRDFAGTIVAVYPLPWGMSNQDEIVPAFEYLPTLQKDVTILMGAADHLAGPENIRKMQEIAAGNPRLTMHLYAGSNHGFFTDIDGDDEALRANSHDAIGKVSKLLF